MGNVCVLDHPLIQHKLSLIRDESTKSKEFREVVEEVAMLMAYEVTRDFPLEEVEVRTLLGYLRRNIADGVALVPILRAGLGMVDGL